MEEKIVSPIRVETIPKPINNYVLVRCETKSHDSIDVAGNKLYIDNTFEVGAHIKLTGIVAAIPDRLRCLDDSPHSIDWETDIDVQVGDKVWFRFMANHTANMGTSKEVYVDGVRHIFINYGMLFMAEREGERFMLNGYVAIEPISKNKKSDFLEAIYEKEDNHTSIGVVRCVGRFNRRYVNEYECDSHVCNGWIVQYRKQYRSQLEYELHSEFQRRKKMYKMQARYIDGHILGYELDGRYYNKDHNELDLSVYE